ncbi:BHLH domain-containing protein [Mycena sanguinolenta]|uniref:BHLH domain-containing protein n=1 Tax=Mycena sanguinolenta TaxID=230812 RepID=A0A8H7CMW8_9AGAR|nr:BHLH domain-containing protein [Mycena sanguinolenta]
MHHPLLQGAPNPMAQPTLHQLVPRVPPVSTTPPMPTFMNFTGEDTINGVPTLGGAKRTSKTTRRVNTAERRATHNAVERQRRETLNGRFLDLASMLSNLSQIRRPSKSAIVNSSIAHLNASRRHRILAAQQLRAMKNEADALRHELNEWRARAGVAFIEEPMRSDAFGIVLRGELEFEAGDMLEGDSGEDDEEAGGVYAGGVHYPPRGRGGQQEHAEMLAQAQLQQAAFVHAGVHPSAVAHAHALPPQGYASSPPAHYYTPSPTIAGPALAAFDNPAMGYEPATQAELWAQQQMMHARHRQQQPQRQGSW